jgi:hypothetical protein
MRAQLNCIYGSNRAPRLTFAPISSAQIDYRNRIETFDRVFGQENVIFRKFQPNTFPEGCVTRDFCRLIGISLNPSQIRRANESLRLDAVRLIFAYGKFAIARSLAEISLFGRGTPAATAAARPRTN